MKIAIFGGSFDPVHYGHLEIAKSCLCFTDKVIFVPCGNHPQKSNLTQSQIRLDLLKKSINGFNNILIDNFELQNSSQKNYTYKTLYYLKEKYKNDELFFVIGADQARNFFTWKEPEKILQIAKIVMFNRSNCKEKFDFVYKNIDFDIDISSSKIRHLVKNNQDISSLTNVYEDILNKHLYLE